MVAFMTDMTYHLNVEFHFNQTKCPEAFIQLSLFCLIVFLCVLSANETTYTAFRYWLALKGVRPRPAAWAPGCQGLAGCARGVPNVSGCGGCAWVAGVVAPPTAGCDPCRQPDVYIPNFNSVWRSASM